MIFYIKWGTSKCGMETQCYSKEKKKKPCISIFAAHYLSLSTIYNLLQDFKLGTYS